MNANSFNKLKTFYGNDPGKIEEAVNKFLTENHGKIKIVKRSMDSIAWGKRQTWDPRIQIVLCYREQKVSYGERVAIIKFEQSDMLETEEKLNKQMAAKHVEAVDLLSTSYISDFQYSYVTSIFALFMKV